MDNQEEELYIYEQEDIKIMLEVKKLLESPIFANKRVDQNYFSILSSIDKYLKKNCHHNIIRDLIDIDGDRSKEILYCERCDTTFS